MVVGEEEVGGAAFLMAKGMHAVCCGGGAAAVFQIAVRAWIGLDCCRGEQRCSGCYYCSELELGCIACGVCKVRPLQLCTSWLIMYMY